MFRTILTLALAVCSLVSAQTASNGVTLTPATMTFNYQIGASALPAAQSLQVTTTPKGLNFTVAITGAPFNAAWLLVSASSGVSPGSLKVEVNRPVWRRATTPGPLLSPPSTGRKPTRLRPA